MVHCQSIFAGQSFNNHQPSIFSNLSFGHRADLAWTPSSRQERPGDKASWLQSSKWRFSKHKQCGKMGDRLKQIREKSKLRRQILAQQVRNTYSDIMRQQMNILQCLNEYYSAISCTNFQILSYFFKEYFIVKHVITWKVKTGQ